MTWNERERSLADYYTKKLAEEALREIPLTLSAVLSPDSTREESRSMTKMLS